MLREGDEIAWKPSTWRPWRKIAFGLFVVAMLVFPLVSKRARAPIDNEQFASCQTAESYAANCEGRRFRLAGRLEVITPDAVFVDVDGSRLSMEFPGEKPEVADNGYRYIVEGTFEPDTIFGADVKDATLQDRLDSDAEREAFLASKAEDDRRAHLKNVCPDVRARGSNEHMISRMCQNGVIQSSTDMGSIIDCINERRALIAACQTSGY